MQQLWLEGTLSLEGKRPLSQLRQIVLGRGVDGDGYEARDVAEDPTDDRAVLFATWTDPYRDGTAVRVLLVAEVPDGGGEVRWCLAAVCDKTWAFRMLPPLLVMGLVTAEIGWCNDPTGLPLSPSALPMIPATARLRKEFADWITPALSDPARRTAMLIIAGDVDWTGDRTAWAGLIDTMLIDEATRQVLNQRLPMRQIPERGARLYLAACDGLPDTEIGLDDRYDQRKLSDAVTRLFAVRRGTALPEGWTTDPALGPWWADPMQPPCEPRPADPVHGATGGEADRLRVELDEARQALAISQRRAASAEAALRAQAADNDLLRSRLAASADEAEVGRLRAQLKEALGERDLYADDNEYLSSERDNLLRIRGILTAELATHVGDRLPDLDAVAEHATFVDLLHAAGHTFTHLVLTADPAPAAGLDGHVHAPVWRRKTWNALATLDAFAAARARRREQGLPLTADLVDVWAFTAAGGPGVAIAAGAVVLRESETVYGNARFHDARCFPVSPEDRSDRAFFGAHIRIGAGGVSPRLHFLDTGPAIIVGYIGTHLPNSLTARI